jgi:amidohydrolase
MLPSNVLDKLISFRHELHKQPELSGSESVTARSIYDKLKETNPSELYEGVGGYGIVAVYKGNRPGRTLLVRTDMDALPIQEENDIEYASIVPGVAHLCGHDGHSAIGVALATLLENGRPETGTTVVLFQPAEETGEGATRMLEDPVMQSLPIESVIALHNLPGIPLHRVMTRDGAFACASVGLTLRFKGRTSHAATPEKAISPVDAISQLINILQPYRTSDDLQSCGFRLVTVVHVTIGERAFGITPGEGVVMLTIRAEDNHLLESVVREIQDNAQLVCDNHGLKMETERNEPFSATINSVGFTSALKKCAHELDLAFAETEQPFRWSEDVGVFIEAYGGGLFVLGAGEDTKNLHHPSYDFPDALISSGSALLFQYIKQWHANA